MSLYLTNLGEIMLIFLKVVVIAVLAFLAGGFIGSFFYKDRTPYEHYYTWRPMMPRPWRIFFWVAAPPVLLFTIPALMVWFR